MLRTQSVMENICSNTAGGVMIDSRASSAAAQPTLSPAPSPERNDRLANLYPPSDICPYGEAPLVTTCRDTAKSVSFGFLRSRQGSELARNIISSNAFLYLPILAATACTSSVRAGSAACGAGRFRPSPPPGTCQTSPPQTHPIFISLPLWRRGIYSMADPVHIIAVRRCKERGSGVSYIKHAGRVRACERG